MLGTRTPAALTASTTAVAALALAIGTPSSASARDITPTPAPTTYTLRVLAPTSIPTPLAGPLTMTAVAVNNAGDVLVQARATNRTARPFVVTRSRTRWLPSAPGLEAVSTAEDLSDRGTVVGTTGFSPTAAPGFTWTAEGAVTLLRVAADQSPLITQPRAINAADLLVSHGSPRPTAPSHFWSGTQWLARISGPEASYFATGIADTGEAIVTYAGVGEPERAALYVRGDKTTQLGCLTTASSCAARATAISPSGRWIVGVSQGRGVLFDRSGAVTPVRGGAGFEPVAVNDAGTIVGSDGSTPSIYQRGTLRALSSAVAGLPRGWSVESVADVNTTGQIAATVRRTDGSSVAALLTPRQTRGIAVRPR